MRKIILAILVLALVSCNNKSVLLPQLDKTIVSKVEDLSTIYIFFKTEGKDTIAELNRSNTISSTNFVFNIDKRLPLKLVIPQVQLVQKKKESSMHKSKTSENYFSYSDSVKKSLAFLPFTKVKYIMEKPKFGIQIYFTEKNKILAFDYASKENKEIKKEDLFKYLISIPGDKPNKFVFCHDLKCSYEEFIKNNVFIAELKLKIPPMNLSNEEFVY